MILLLKTIQYKKRFICSLSLKVAFHPCKNTLISFRSSCLCLLERKCSKKIGYHKAFQIISARSELKQGAFQLLQDWRQEYSSRVFMQFHRYFTREANANEENIQDGTVNQKG